MSPRTLKPPHAETASSEPDTAGLLTIDLSAIVTNWRELKMRAEPAECAAVVKADAYGCGIEPVGAALSKAGCETFFVAHLAEARRLRSVGPGATIYVLNGLMPGTAPAYADGHFRPVLGSLGDLADWESFVTANDWRGGAALHIDTGMNRLGLRMQEAAAIAPRVARTHGLVTLVMSHFASSEVPDHPLNAKQMGLFGEVRAMFPNTPASLANSSGIFLGPDAHHDLVRPGVALYGANPTPGHINLMRAAVQLQGRVIQVRVVEQGETVGYNGTWTAKRPSRIAVIGVGYADGYLRAASVTDTKAGAEAIVAGHRCALAGRVSMDLLTVDVTDLPETQPRRGDLVTLLGEDITVDDLASHADTIGYEVLTSLGRRYRRVYTGG